jgi:hypothetical protein
VRCACAYHCRRPSRLSSDFPRGLFAYATHLFVSLLSVRPQRAFCQLIVPVEDSSFILGRRWHGGSRRHSSTRRAIHPHHGGVGRRVTPPFLPTSDALPSSFTHDRQTMPSLNAPFVDSPALLNNQTTPTDNVIHLHSASSFVACPTTPTVRRQSTYPAHRYYYHHYL